MTLKCACGRAGQPHEQCEAGLAIRPDPHAGQAAAENVRAYGQALRRETTAAYLLAEAYVCLTARCEDTRGVGTGDVAGLMDRIGSWLREADAATRQAQIDEMAFEAGDDDEARRGAQET